ncbi:hypothetical protein [Enterococcus faecalis]|uniref:hypothetical protein n=1 Tax=Enterococcus faecalis TaxID=1351 RepID=UPI003D208BFD
MGGIFRIFPFDMEHTITRQIFCPWLFAFSMTRKQFQDISWLAEKGYPLKAIMD